jgi:hypothetical protein
MILKQRLFSNMFLRNMFADLVGRSAYTKSPGGFEPYFQYKVVKQPQQDYLLYFPKEPFALLYKNEVFNKLCEYCGSDIAMFLDFHYAVYSNKENFLRFLNFEIAERINRKLNRERILKLKSALRWISEKQDRLKKFNNGTYKQGSGQIMPVTIENIVTGNDPSRKTDGQITELLDEVEERIKALKSSLPAGNIQLNNQNHFEKLMQFLYLVQNIQSPARARKREFLFKKFTNYDLASILHMHFGGFTDKKLNTVEKNIRESRDLLKFDNPKVKKLEAALQDFFY